MFSVTGSRIIDYLADEGIDFNLLVKFFPKFKNLLDLFFKIFEELPYMELFSSIFYLLLLFFSVYFEFFIFDFLFFSVFLLDF